MTILETVYAQGWPLLAVLLVIYATKKIAAYRRLSHFKGPFGSGFTQFPHSRRLIKTEASAWYEDAVNEYGPIARIGPNLLITANPEIWARINSKPNYKRTDWFYQSARFEYQRDMIFSQTDNALHDKRRKQLAPGYSGRENPALEATIDTHILSLLHLLRTKYLSTPTHPVIPMDLSKKIQYLTLDIISTLGTSRPFGMLAADADISSYIANGEAGLLIGNTFMALGLEGIRQAPLIGKLIAPSPTDSSGFGKMLGTCFEIVDARWAEPEAEKKKRVDMLASWMKAGLSRDDLRSETVEQILAGSDTTASALRGVFLYLMTNPRVYGRLQREFDEAAEKGGVEVGETGVVTLAATKRMVYLQAVIREAMRVWPPVVNLFPHDVPPEGDTVVVDGRSWFLPGGTEIGLSVTGMMHSKEIFGEDAKCFRPERWLEEEDEERLVRMTRTTDLIFGHGRWQCLGKSIAQLEIGKTVYEVLRKFDLALVDPTRPWRTKAPLGLFVINDMWVQVTAR